MFLCLCDVLPLESGPSCCQMFRDKRGIDTSFMQRLVLAARCRAGWQQWLRLLLDCVVGSTSPSSAALLPRAEPNPLVCYLSKALGSKVLKCLCLSVGIDSYFLHGSSPIQIVSWHQSDCTNLGRVKRWPIRFITDLEGWLTCGPLEAQQADGVDR